MKTTLHLISMPFERTTTPSIQLGCLKAYVDRAFAGRVTTHAYSAFFGIVVRETAQGPEVRRNPLFDTVTALESTTFRMRAGGLEPLYRYQIGELPYFLLYHRRFGVPATRTLLARSLRDAVSSTGDDSDWVAKACTNEDNLGALEAATIDYAESRIVPNLSADGVNVVGLSCTFNQTYASAYLLRWLQARCPAHRFVFLFGGSSIGMPTTAATLRRLELDALCVIGEGEPKLHQLLETCLAADERIEDLSGVLEDPACGVLHASRDYDCTRPNPDFRSKQLKSLDVLPCPDYDEFFVDLTSKCADADERARAVAQLELPLEGSRGCAFACTFCNLNHLWSGYRIQDAELIMTHVLELQRKYGTPTSRIRFVDNLCNWASAFADLAIVQGRKVNCFLELRARYPETFWRKLGAIGVWGVQIGIEALSTDLLAVMNKKARAIDNVRAMKFMAEQAVTHRSNFIINYPGSTLGHVEESRRVLSHLVHLPPLASTAYDLVEGSPLYYDLPTSVKASLVPRRNLRFARELAELVTDFAFTVPSSLAPPGDVLAAWQALDEWYRSATASPRQFTIARRGTSLEILDDRWGERREVVVDGVRAAILDACHRGLRLHEVAATVGIDLDTAGGLVDALVDDLLLLRVDELYINVALRPRSEVEGLALDPARPSRWKRQRAVHLPVLEE